MRMINLRWLLSAALVSILVLSCSGHPAHRDDKYSEATRRLLPSLALRDSVSYLLGVNFAAMLGYGGGGTDGDDFGSIDFQRVKEGIDDFIKADKNGVYRTFLQNGFEGEAYEEFAGKLDIDPAITDELIMRYLEARQNARAKDNREKGRDFFEKNRTQGGIREAEVAYPDPEHPSDSLTAQIQYKITRSGAGPAVAYGDSLLLSYTATRLGGALFDQADSLGISAFADSLFLRGFSAGLLKLREGDTAELYVPSELGFGNGRDTTGRLIFSPYATILFDVSVHAVVKPEAKEEAETVEE